MHVEFYKCMDSQNLHQLSLHRAHRTQTVSNSLEIFFCTGKKSKPTQFYKLFFFSENVSNIHLSKTLVTYTCFICLFFFLKPE